MQLGFVIDHSRCIGCHACTVACKSENDVPLGSFRTWVKYTETGEFPAVRRHFAVLRCNQCTDAPCVTICPTRALEKRPDGIVDVSRDYCIGCKSCMQGCPYDALYIHPDRGTAEKCHFCAHRTERGLAPACAIVCPTEAIVPGDFDDPESRVSRLRDAGGLAGRKLEAGTGPNVLYREVDPTGISPLQTNGAGGYLWATRPPGPQAEAELFQALEARAGGGDGSAMPGRTTYDIPKQPMWGSRVSGYLLTKSISAGVILAGLPLFGSSSRAADLAVPALGLLFLLVTTALLIADLKRPERFLLILRRPNWSSWLVKGTVALAGYGALLTAWLGLDLAGVESGGIARGPLGWLTAAAAAAAAGYTAFLFGQAKGRVLWMQRGLALQLVLQALVAGGGLLILLAPLAGVTAEELGGTRILLGVGLAGQLAFSLAGGALAPRGREAEYRRARRLLTHGPHRGRHLGVAAAMGATLLLLLVPSTPVLAVAGAVALVALAIEEDLLVRAGQALPIS